MDAHDVETVRALCAGVPHLTVLDVALSPSGRQVVVTITPLAVSAQTLVKHLYQAMRRDDTSYYGVSWSALPGQPVEELLFVKVD